MKYFGYCFILILLFNVSNQAQGKKIQFEFLPPGLNFAPLKANMQEAKMGVLYFPDNSNLKVDIGNNADLVKIKFPKNIISIASGISAAPWSRHSEPIIVRMVTISSAIVETISADCMFCLNSN